MPKSLHTDIEEYVINEVRKKRITMGISQKELAYLLEMSVGFYREYRKSKIQSKV